MNEIKKKKKIFKAKERPIVRAERKKFQGSSVYEKKKRTFRKSFQETKPQERSFAITAAKN